MGSYTDLARRTFEMIVVSQNIQELSSTMAIGRAIHLGDIGNHLAICRMGKSPPPNSNQQIKHTLFKNDYNLVVSQ